VSRDAPPEQRWLAAVALGAQGWYASACALLDDLYRDRSVPSAVRANSAVTRAAHLRQLGGHLAARRWDARGLALATGGPSEPAVQSARIDALIGLAADAVGLAELDLADRMLAGAGRMAQEHPAWRTSVRLCWVRAELALCRVRPDEAVRWARGAVADSRAAGAVRHEIKSELVLVVSELATGLSGGEAIARLNQLFQRTKRAGLDTLEWVINLLLAGTFEAFESPEAVVQRRLARVKLREIRLRTDSVGRSVFDRSPWVPNLDGI
jgi:hypothetical protein